MNAPIVVCFSGSTRFARDFNELAVVRTLAGEVVLRPEVVQYDEAGDPQRSDRHTKARLDVLHFAKIDLADYLLVVNRDGYVGESTEREIEYARMRGKAVYYAMARSADGTWVRTGFWDVDVHPDFR